MTMRLIYTAAMRDYGIIKRKNEYLKNQCIQYEYNLCIE